MNLGNKNFIQSLKLIEQYKNFPSELKRIRIKVDHMGNDRTESEW